MFFGAVAAVLVTTGPLLAQTEVASLPQLTQSLGANPIGGDFLAADVADLVKLDPINLETILEALSTMSNPQRRSIARGIFTAVRDIEAVGTDASVESAQAISLRVAEILVCMEPGSAAAGLNCAWLGDESRAFADTYSALSSGEATTAISPAASVLPGPIAVQQPVSGPLGTDGAQAGGGDVLSDTLRQTFSAGNVTVFSTTGVAGVAASVSPTTL